MVRSFVFARIQNTDFFPFHRNSNRFMTEAILSNTNNNFFFILSVLLSTEDIRKTYLFLNIMQRDDQCCGSGFPVNLMNHLY